MNPKLEMVMSPKIDTTTTTADHMLVSQGNFGTQNYAFKASTYEANNNIVARPKLSQAHDHIIAERKRREKLSQRFIALSALVPGLKKMEKASVLGDAIKYLKQVQEKVSALEQEQNRKKTVESVVIVKKSQLSNNDFEESSSDTGSGTFDEALAEIEARFSERNVLIRVHCEKNKGVIEKTINEIEKLHLKVINSSALTFDLKESIVKGMGLSAEDFKITGFDPRDAQVGHSVQYEFNVEIDRKVIPFKLLEDVNRWDYVDLPIFRVDEPGQENGLVQKRDSGNGSPVLAPFQLAGPMELWIQDAKDMRLSLPHDVDAGVLKKVILADGAVVTVKGARSVSLRQPLDFTLPLNRSQNGFAAGLLTLAEQLRHASRAQGAPLLSLRIVGPTSLAAAPSSTSASFKNRLKLKRIAPGLVELSSPSNTKGETVPTIDLQGEAPTLLTPTHFSTFWPLASINGSNANLLGFEKLLASVLGPKANKKGSFKLVKADVSAQTFVKIGFQAEKKLKEGDGFSLEGFPEWRTKPETVSMHFEVLAKVDGDKVTAERIMPVKPVMVEDTIAQNVLTGNVTMSKTPVVNPPPKYFTL